MKQRSRLDIPFPQLDTRYCVPRRKSVLHWKSLGALGLLLTGWWLGGCGASYQAMYEGEVRFEHCYKLDEDASVPPAQKRACWADWTRRYPKGQSRDRYTYALKRQEELTALINGTPMPRSPTTAGPSPSGRVAVVEPKPAAPTDDSRHGLLPQGPPRVASPSPCTHACETARDTCNRWCGKTPDPKPCHHGCSMAFSDCLAECSR